tara:strand:+ start:3852 stop:4217 length:366 start_codon:yes stop_codon:yes gene_type:complete
MKFIDIPFVPFEDFKMPPFPTCGVKANLEFNNGYKVSVIMTNMSYGGTKGLYEIMVTDQKDESIWLEGINNEDGVIGFLTPLQLETTLTAIEQAAPKEPTPPKVNNVRSLFPKQRLSVVKE